MKNHLLVLSFIVIILQCACLLPENLNNITNILTTEPPTTCMTLGGQILKKNQIISSEIGECYGIRCNATTLQLDDELCGMAPVRKGCHGRSYDFSVPYPDCCPREVC